MSDTKADISLPSESEKQALYDRLSEDALKAGYHINPDKEFVFLLMNGLLINEGRFGYLCCPCRLSAKDIELDRDIICPCNYRDADVLNYDACYCSLYVSSKVLSGEVVAHSIPESRPPLEERRKQKFSDLRQLGALGALAFPVWRCSVCGYLCARDNAPEICPICKVKQDRFERFL
jgi:ferredoxin-thioredoxin reductase catalytic chain